MHVIIFNDADAAEESGAADGDDAQKECIMGTFGSVEPQEPSGGHCDSGAAHAGDEGEGLGQSDEDCVFECDVF